MATIDQFWGGCSCEGCVEKAGKNHLGLLLMRIRDEQESE